MFEKLKPIDPDLPAWLIDLEYFETGPDTYELPRHLVVEALFEGETMLDLTMIKIVEAHRLVKFLTPGRRPRRAFVRRRRRSQPSPYYVTTIGSSQTIDIRTGDVVPAHLLPEATDFPEEVRRASPPLVQVRDSAGRTIWSRDASVPSGTTSRGYLSDGTQAKIIAALEEALDQARGEAGWAARRLRVDEPDAVADVRPAAAEVDHDIPVAGVRHTDPHGKMGEEPAVVAVSPPRAIGPEVAVVEQDDIALVRAVDEHDRPG